MTTELKLTWRDRCRRGNVIYSKKLPQMQNFETNSEEMYSEKIHRKLQGIVLSEQFMRKTWKNRVFVNKWVRNRHFDVICDYSHSFATTENLRHYIRMKSTENAPFCLANFYSCCVFWNMLILFTKLENRIWNIDRNKWNDYNDHCNHFIHQKLKTTYAYNWPIWSPLSSVKWVSL